MITTKRLAITHPLRAFGFIWFGQLVSLIGSGLTGFALGVWVYQRTGSVTQYALIFGSSQAIWQSKVEPDVQGRVFAARATIAWSALPFAYLSAGPLVDHVFEPLLAPEGPLAGSLGQLVGMGTGRGIGLLFIVLGILSVLATVGGYLYPRLRLVEDELPDAVGDLAEAWS